MKRESLCIIHYISRYSLKFLLIIFENYSKLYFQTNIFTMEKEIEDFEKEVQLYKDKLKQCMYHILPNYPSMSKDHQHDGVRANESMGC